MEWIQMVSVGVAVWFLTSRGTAIRREKLKLQAERKKIYIQILEPYVRALAGAKNQEEAEEGWKLVKSFKYRKAAFELNMIGSDAVVEAFNEFMQYFFQLDDPANADPGEVMLRWTRVLLAIRRDLGNRWTRLKEEDMLKSSIVDIESLLGDD